MTGGLVPRRRSSREWDETGIRLNVFVAGLIAAGAVMSLIVGLTESIASTRGRERLHAKAIPVAEMLASGVVHGYDETARSRVGLRPRGHYVAIALAVGVVAPLPLIAGFDDFFSEDSGGLILGALSLSATLMLLAIATVFAVAAARYPVVPGAVRRLAPARPKRTTSVWAVVGGPRHAVVYLMVGLIVILELLVVMAEEALLEIDEPLYFDWLEASGRADRWTPDWVNLLGRQEWAISISIVLGLILLRHRFVAIAYPAVIVIGGLTNFFVNWITHRARPPLSGHAGEFSSFPGGHSIQLTLLLGMLPLAAAILTGRRWVGLLVAAAAAAAWAAAMADVLRTGGHWPTDHLAGVLIALALLVVVYGVAADAPSDA